MMVENLVNQIGLYIGLKPFSFRVESGYTPGVYIDELKPHPNLLGKNCSGKQGTIISVARNQFVKTANIKCHTCYRIVKESI